MVGEVVGLRAFKKRLQASIDIFSSKIKKWRHFIKKKKEKEEAEEEGALQYILNCSSKAEDGRFIWGL